MTKLKITVVAIIITILSAITLPVFAADHTFSFIVAPETISVKAGETVTINLGIADIDQSTDGINAIQGEIEYDKDMFENVSIKPIAENWSVQYNESNNGKFVLAILGSEKESKNVAKLTATVKKDTELKTGTITFKDVFSSYQDLTTTEKLIKNVIVNIESQGTNNGDNNDNNNVIIDDNSNNNAAAIPSSGDKSGSSKQTQSSSVANKTTLPKTGVVSWIGIIIAAIAIVGIIEFIKYKRSMK